MMGLGILPGAFFTPTATKGVSTTIATRNPAADNPNLVSTSPGGGGGSASSDNTLPLPESLLPVNEEVTPFYKKPMTWIAVAGIAAAGAATYAIARRRRAG